MDRSHIRNFAIIAHIDHGKSTLADRLLELTGSLSAREMQAQRLTQAYLAIHNKLEIIPIINKVDLPSADIERTREMIESAVGLDATDAIPISAKTGLNVPDVLEAIVKRIPPPKGSPELPLQ